MQGLPMTTSVTGNKWIACTGLSLSVPVVIELVG
jgi:hypothetical protein